MNEICSPACIPVSQILSSGKIIPFREPFPHFHLFFCSWLNLSIWTGRVGRLAAKWGVERERERERRLWQTSIWPRLLSESSLACQISVLTVNIRICAEHRRVSCTMAWWFRISLDKAIGWLTQTSTLLLCLFLAKNEKRFSLFMCKMTMNENTHSFFVNKRNQLRD